MIEKKQLRKEREKHSKRALCLHSFHLPDTLCALSYFVFIILSTL